MLFSSLLVFPLWRSCGQNDFFFNHYTFNPSYFNPAWTGVRRDDAFVAAHHRTQWAGYDATFDPEGAPTTQLIIIAVCPSSEEESRVQESRCPTDSNWISTSVFEVIRQELQVSLPPFLVRAQGQIYVRIITGLQYSNRSTLEILGHQILLSSLAQNNLNSDQIFMQGLNTSLASMKLAYRLRT